MKSRLNPGDCIVQRARVNRAEPRAVFTVRGSAFMLYRLDVEAELHHVTIIHDVVLALH